MTRIALVGFAPRYFGAFATAIEASGAEVYWVCATASDAHFLANRGVPSSRVLDVLSGFRAGESDEAGDEAGVRQRLLALEGEGAPRVYDIVLMDRVLRGKRTSVALRYLDHVRAQLVAFLERNEISLLVSGRDTALQLSSMLVARSMGLTWVVPTRLRIPRETFGFCTTHETESFLPLRSPSAEDVDWAEAVLADFQDGAAPPALKLAARSFRDVVRMLPRHARVFRDQVRLASRDRGNDVSRYTLPQLVRMYIKRKMNLLGYGFRVGAEQPGVLPFCLYALHTQPESSIDVAASYFSDQLAVIPFIARSLPASHELYVKVHPTDVDGKPPSFYQAIRQIPGVRLIDYSISSRSLMSNAAIIFALTGTIGYEAALQGRPVITFARNFYNGFPSVHYCEAPTRLPSLVASLLSDTRPQVPREAIRDALVRLRPCVVDGEFNRMYGETPGPLHPEDCASVERAFRALLPILRSSVHS